MSWFNRKNAGIGKSDLKKVKVPEGMWVKCQGCSETILSKDIDANLCVCPKCGYHYRIAARRRLEILLDEGVWKEFDAGMTSVDFLEFKDAKSYQERINAALAKGGSKDAVICVEGTIEETVVQLSIFDFSFMGGSMGIVVGEKITRSI